MQRLYPAFSRFRRFVRVPCRMRYPVTPDGRYFVVRGRLWRCSNPGLDAGEHAALVKALMQARRAVKEALAAKDEAALKAARVQVHEIKVALGERGPVWWTDGAPDYNRRMAINTPYRAWYQSVPGE